MALFVKIVAVTLGVGVLIAIGVMIGLGWAIRQLEKMDKEGEDK